MKCPTCGKQTKGRDHNKRGLRCTWCWAPLPKPKRSHKPKAEVEVKDVDEAVEAIKTLSKASK